MPIEYPMQKTLVTNLFSGPGAGKSTLAAGIFFELKMRDINCELAAEYAKDLVWEQRQYTLDDQIYLFGKQYHRIFRLLGKVNVIITDSPILLTPIYDKEHRQSLEQLVIDEHNKMWTYNVFISRAKKYKPEGRNEDETEAKAIDREIADLLYKYNIPFETYDGIYDSKNKIVDKIIMLLNYEKE